MAVMRTSVGRLRLAGSWTLGEAKPCLPVGDRDAAAVKLPRGKSGRPALASGPRQEAREEGWLSGREERGLPQAGAPRERKAA